MALASTHTHNVKIFRFCRLNCKYCLFNGKTYRRMNGAAVIKWKRVIEIEIERKAVEKNVERVRSAHNRNAVIWMFLWDVAVIRIRIHCIIQLMCVLHVFHFGWEGEMERESQSVCLLFYLTCDGIENGGSWKKKKNTHIGWSNSEACRFFELSTSKSADSNRGNWKQKGNNV